MTRTLALLVVAAGCGGDQGFSSAKDDGANEQGVGVMEVTPTEVVFTDMNWEEGVASSQTLKITNIGDNNLALYDVGITNSGDGAFYMEDFTESQLSPGVSAEFQVVATITAFVEAEGEARVLCNDADAHDYRIPLTALPLGWVQDTGSDTGTR